VEAVGIEEARRTFGDLVDRARLAGEPSLITRHGKSAAVLVNVGGTEGPPKRSKPPSLRTHVQPMCNWGRHEHPFWLVRALSCKFTLD
jgi:prevent-host-death family protein